MSDLDQLSRLLDGDLPDDEAAALRARIAADPALAAAWATVQDVVRGLEALDDAPPPAHLDAAVLAAADAPGSARPWGVAALLAAAAVLVLAVLARPSPAIEVATASDGWTVHGPATLAIDGHTVRLDGRARVRMEPVPGAVRGPAGEEDAMDRSLLLGAAGGAALTFAVLEGTATVTAPDGHVHVATPGTAIGLPVAAPAARPSPAAPVPDAPADDAASALAALRAENTDLRDQLARAEARAAFHEGQLRAEQGTPVPWPDDTPPDYLPAAFRARAEAAAEAMPELALASLACEEFPCIAVFAGDAPADPTALRGLQERLAAEMAPAGEADTMAMVAVEEGPDGGEVLVGLAFTPGGEGDPTGSPAHQRLKFRAEELMAAASEAP